jgi:hypothetical protein
MTTRPNI